MGSEIECSECAINKAGKRSCCARGGAWFKDCGDVGDTKFGHTWAEGIQACKDFATSALADTASKAILGARAIVDSQSRNEDKLKENVYIRSGMAESGATDYADCFRLSRTSLSILMISISF